MPSAREFENAAVDFCLDNSNVGVWAVRLEQVNPITYDITIRLGGRYRADTGGVAIVRVTYSPEELRFVCQPAEWTTPELALVDELAYLFN